MKRFKGVAIFIAVLLILAAVVFACAFLPRLLHKDDKPVSANPGSEQESEPTNEEEPTLLRYAQGHTPTVVIDAGHGFGDVGCAGPETALGCYEYQLTIDMARTLRSYLSGLGYEVYLTHDGNTFPSIAEIKALADRYGVEYDDTKETWCDNDIFSPYERVIYMNCLDAMYGVNFAISIHVNANADSDQLSGFDLDYCMQNPYAKESRMFAIAIKDTLNSIYPNTNLWYYEDSWEDAFIVTKFNTMPSALLETGYYTNANDVENLKSKVWRDKLMQTLSQTISDVLEAQR